MYWSEVRKLLFMLACILLSLFVGILIGRETGGYEDGYKRAVEDCRIILDIPKELN